MKSSKFIAFIIFCFFMVFACSKSPTTPDSVETPSPVINSFTATPSTVASGDFSTLEWSTTNATSATIDQGIGQVGTTGSTLVDPEETTTYTLTATNSNGSRQATCTIEVKSAFLEVVGVIREKMTSYGCPKFEGYVRNSGDNTAYNAGITIYCYSDAAQTTLIDTAWDYLADGNDIRPGEKVTFSAICFDLTSHDQIKSTRIELDWLEREIEGMSVEDIVKVEESQRRWQELQMKEADAIYRMQNKRIKIR